MYANLFFSEYFLHKSPIRRNAYIHVTADISEMWKIEINLSSNQSGDGTYQYTNW
jgi:hypothetical protein